MGVLFPIEGVVLLLDVDVAVLVDVGMAVLVDVGVVVLQVDCT